MASRQGESLIAAVKRTLQERSLVSDAVGQEAGQVARALDALPAEIGDGHESSHPILEVADAALAKQNPATSAVLDLLRPLIRSLPWQYNYPERVDLPGLGRHIAFAEIIGPAAPLVSETICVGFTLIAPETQYPTHHHPATELYWVLSGSATWIHHGLAQRQEPGTFILHPSQAPHAMLTHGEPLLALYTWSGLDVRTTSAYV